MVAMRLTFLVVVGFEILGAEKRLGQSVIPFLNDQGLSVLDHTKKNKLLKLLRTNVADLRRSDAGDPLEIRSALDKRM